MSDKDVHTEHCCVHHCKYASEDDDRLCSVVSGRLKQSFKCSEIEACGMMTDDEVKASRIREKGS